jgi:hypothetical protein
VVSQVEQRAGIVLADRAHPGDAGHPAQQRQRQRRLVEGREHERALGCDVADLLEQRVDVVAGQLR